MGEEPRRLRPPAPVNRPQHRSTRTSASSRCPGTKSPARCGSSRPLLEADAADERIDGAACFPDASAPADAEADAVAIAQLRQDRERSPGIKHYGHPIVFAESAGAPDDLTLAPIALLLVVAGRHRLR